MAQLKFPSPFSRAYVESPQLLQDALDRIHIGPFQADGELHEADEGVTLRPWTTFRRVLDHLYEHPDRFRSVTPSARWLEWLQELDDQAPFSPTDKLDLMRSLWKLMEKANDGKPSHTYTMRECEWELLDRRTWTERSRPPPITQLQVLKWRHWRPAQLRDLEPTTQRALEEKLRIHWSNRLISHLIPFAAEIPAMAAMMGEGDDHLEFLHLLGDARFSTLMQRCLFFEKLKKQGLLQVPWTEPPEAAVRQMLSKLHALGVHSQLHPTGLGHFEVVQHQVSDLGRRVFAQAPSKEEVYPRDTANNRIHSSAEGSGSLSGGYLGPGKGCGCRWRCLPLKRGSGTGWH